MTVRVIVVTVSMVEVIVSVTVVAKVMVWAAVVKALIIDVLVDVDFIVVVIVLGFVVSASYSVNEPSDTTVDLFINELTGVMLSVLTNIGIGVMADVNANAFEFLVSTP